MRPFSKLSAHSLFLVLILVPLWTTMVVLTRAWWQDGGENEHASSDRAAQEQSHAGEGADQTGGVARGLPARFKDHESRLVRRALTFLFIQLLRIEIQNVVPRAAKETARGLAHTPRHYLGTT